MRVDHTMQAALEVLGTGLARKAAPSQSLTRAISSLKERMAEAAPTGPKVVSGLWLLHKRDGDSLLSGYVESSTAEHAAALSLSRACHPWQAVASLRQPHLVPIGLFCWMM